MSWEKSISLVSTVVLVLVTICIIAVIVLSELWKDKNKLPPIIINTPTPETHPLVERRFELGMPSRIRSGELIKADGEVCNISDKDVQYSYTVGIYSANLLNPPAFQTGETPQRTLTANSCLETPLTLTGIQMIAGVWRIAITIHVNGFVQPVVLSVDFEVIP